MKKFGIIGEKLGHTFSPFIHKEILKHINISGEYNVLEFDRSNVPNIIDILKKENYSGACVTIPYKTDIMPYLDKISEEAKKIGAINTIHFLNNETIGYNTDYFGFGKLLDYYKIDIKDKSALILGTGGASRAVVQYLNDNHIKSIKFASSNIKNANNKYSGYKIYTYEMLDEIENTDIVINCTPVGMFKDRDNTPINKEYLSKFHVAVDIIYNPLETTFLRQAREIGLKTANGLYMLIAQAVKAQEIWNNISIDDKIIDEINTLLLEELKNV